MALSKQERRFRIRRRIRKVVSGTQEVPRLSVFRSNKDIYAQVINDNEGKTLASASSLKLDGKGKNKTELAFEVGTAIAETAKQNGIEKVVFDRGGYLYHGRVKSLADGARKGGLKF
ncbi:MAG: 50S ribosomal protein L18 [Bacteroidetes bacterium]|nr:MAG: 50S ribosomal protein L18 [Bacteroidota bacterium]